MVEPILLSVVIGSLINSAPGWFNSLQNTFVAYDLAKQQVTSFFDKKKLERHVELALQNAAERGLAKFHTSEERNRYRHILSILSEPGQHSEELRSEAMRLFTHSDNPDLSNLTEKYNLSQRMRSLANQQAHEEVDATPYLSSFFEALIAELYNDPLFQAQMSDVIRVRAALQGQRSLEDVVAILHQISGILESDYTAEQFQADVRTYVEYVETIYHYHSLVGVSLQGGEDTRPELDAIFVPLRISLQDSTTPQKQDPAALIPLLEQAPYLVLLGGPGFGKSTTTRYLAWRHAAANMVGTSKKAMVLRGEPVPLRIELRPFAEAQKRRPNSFLSYTTEVLLEREGITSIKVQMFEELLKRRLMLLLFDGLDEVSTLDERRQLIEQIERFALRYPGNRIVVTSRPVGYEIASFSRRWFKHGVIQEFNDEQISRFLEGFYAYVLKYPQFSSEARKEREIFNKSLKDSSRLHKLARNPLLLTVTTALFHAERLPDKRVQIYEKCADLLLNTWAKLRNTDARWKDMKISKDDQKACLAHLGFVLHEKSQEQEEDVTEAVERPPRSSEDPATDVSARFILREIVRFLENQNRNLSVAGQKVEAELFLELVKEEAGLIVERGKDEHGLPLYGFVHRTFQEYFAAVDVYERYLEEEDTSIISEFLEKHVHDPHWREVILLLFGKLKRKPATVQLRHILEGKSRRSTYSDVIQQDLFFVCNCLADETPVVDDFARHVVSRLRELVQGSPFPSQRREALNALGTLLQTSEYAERARQQLRLFVEESIEVGIATRIEAALILYINTQDETEQLEILQKLLDVMQHSVIPFEPALRAARTLYEYGSSGSEIRLKAVQLLLPLAQSPSLSFEQARQAIEVLDELTSSDESKVNQQAAQFLLTFVQRSHLPFEQLIQAVEALYRYSAAGSEAWQQITQLLLALIGRADLSLEQVIQVARVLYRYTVSDSQERHQTTEKLFALTQRPDLPVEQGLRLAEFFHRNSATRAQERRQAIQMLVALTQRPDLSLEQVIQIHEFFLEYGSARSEERRRAVQYLEELTHQSKASFEQRIQAYEFFYESGSASPEDRRRATQYLEELAGEDHLLVEQVISIAEFFSKSSRSGPSEEQLAIRLLARLIRRPDLSPGQTMQAIEALYRLVPSGGVDVQQAVQYLVELIQRSDLSPEQMMQAVEVFYHLDPYDEREQQLVARQLISLLRRPDLTPEQMLEAASILYIYSTAESEERGYALEVIRKCILEQSAPIEQKLQAAAVPFIVREHNYTDRVAAVQMVLTLIQGEAAKKYLAEKWQQLPSRDHRQSPLREIHRGHAFVTHLPSICELACLDVLSPEVRDEMYNILRTTVPRFGDIVTPRLSS